MLKENMPKEIQTRKKTVQDLQQVVAEPAMGQSDLDDINQKVRKSKVASWFPNTVAHFNFHFFHSKFKYAILYFFFKLRPRSDCRIYL